MECESRRYEPLWLANRLGSFIIVILEIGGKITEKNFYSHYNIGTYKMSLVIEPREKAMIFLS